MQICCPDCWGDWWSRYVLQCTAWYVNHNFRTNKQFNARRPYLGTGLWLCFNKKIPLHFWQWLETFHSEEEWTHFTPRMYYVGKSSRKSWKCAKEITGWNSYGTPLYRLNESICTIICLVTKHWQLSRTNMPLMCRMHFCTKSIYSCTSTSMGWDWNSLVSITHWLCRTLQRYNVPHRGGCSQQMVRNFPDDIYNNISYCENSTYFICPSRHT